MKKLFIGFPVESEDVEQTVVTWQNDPKLNLNLFNWVRPENWHVTLYFLGETGETEKLLLQHLIEESFLSVKRFSTMVTGTGVFPGLSNPKVWWLGIENLQLMMTSYNLLGDLLRKNGFAFDNKPLKPHLTIARIKHLILGDSFDLFLTQNRDLNFGPVEINRIVLYQSITTPNGPYYKPLYVKVLGLEERKAT